jgi:hypothetical protein
VSGRTIPLRKLFACDNLGHFLKAEGSVLDKIEDTIDRAIIGVIPASCLRIVGWTDGYPPESFWRTLIANRDRADDSLPAYF